MKKRKCPRCAGKIEVVARTHPRRLVTGVAICRSCGRGWGVGATELHKGEGKERLKELAGIYSAKWNRTGLGNL